MRETVFVCEYVSVSCTNGKWGKFISYFKIFNIKHTQSLNFEKLTQNLTFSSLIAYFTLFCISYSTIGNCRWYQSKHTISDQLSKVKSIKRGKHVFFGPFWLFLFNLFIMLNAHKLWFFLAPWWLWVLEYWFNVPEYEIPDQWNYPNPIWVKPSFWYRLYSSLHIQLCLIKYAEHAW